MDKTYKKGVFLVIELGSTRIKARHLYPGCAVMNLGTSGQLSVVEDAPFRPWHEGALEHRPYPGGKTLLCHISLVGGKAFADLRDELGFTWDEMNVRAETDGRIASCINHVIDDLVGGIDFANISSLVGVGNALTRNPAIRRAVERRFDVPCVIPDVAEMAAYGAAIATSHSIEWPKRGHQRHVWLLKLKNI